MGCGYDKLSTATAEALNNDKRIMKLLYKYKELMLNKIDKTQINCINDKNKDLTSKSILGYGSGYGIKPHFEGGVGWECHQSILEKVNLSMRRVTSTKYIDVFIIKRVTAESFKK